MLLSAKRILYIRSAPFTPNLDSYNLQEIGLGMAFCRRGFDFDIVYYSKENKDQVIDVDEKKLTILWRKGIRILRTGLFSFVLKKDFLDKYDYVIVSEYSQIMSYIVSKRHDNVVMYSGPYYNLFYLPFMSPIYDALFTKKINKNIKHKFVKSILAKQFLEEKGYTGVESIGVALDIERFDVDVEIQPDTQNLIDYMKDNKCILYVGALSDRKNYPFLLEVYKKVLKDNPDVRFVMIGKGDKRYVDKYMSTLTDEEQSKIYHLERIDNAQLKYIYPLAKAFLLPSKLEIFGMVLLESMYLGAPVVTSWNGGSSTLIDGHNTGQIVREFDSEKWKTAVQKYLDDEEYTKEIVRNARDLIATEYVWDALANKILMSIVGKD